jgi:hypothetical protein
VKRRATQLLLAVGSLPLLVGVAALVRGSWVTQTFWFSWVPPPRDGVQVVHDVDVRVGRQVCWVIVMRTQRRLDGVETTAWRPRFMVEPGTPQPPEPLLRSAGSSIADRLGFMPVWRGSARPHPHTERGAAVPTWFIAMLGAMAVLPGLLSLRRARRQRSRRAQGLCPACGYNLRGAEHERCPECGVAVARPATE